MKSLESYKGFTAVAWILIILFSAFVYHLVTVFNEKASHISETQTVQAFDTPSHSAAVQPRQ